MRTAGLLLASVACAQVPFTGLSTSADGSVLHFSTMLRQAGTSQLNYGKIFRVTPEKGVELVLERDFVPIPPGSGVITTTSNYYQFGDTFTGDDGSLLGYTEIRDCVGPSSGACVANRQRTVRAGLEFLGATAKFSSNREYALAARAGGLGTNTFALYRAGQFVRNTPAIHGLGSYDVGDDGSFAYDAASDGDFTTIITSQGKQIVEPGKPLLQFLGSSVYLLQPTGALEAIDLASGRRRQVRDGLESCPIRLGLSGTLYQACQGLRRVSLRGGQPEPLTPDQMVDFVVSRNESIVWYLSAAGEVKSLDLITGATRTYIRRTPILTPLLTPISRGDLTQLQGSALAPAHTAGAPLPLELEGVRVRVNGELAPIASVRPDGVVFQLPPSVSNPVTIGVEVTGTSEFAVPFETISLGVNLHYPRLVLSPGGELTQGFGRTPLALIAHGDWSGLVTNARPAQAGQVIHLYLTGLSLVPGTPPLGHAAPLDRAVPFDGAVECSLSQATPEIKPVETLFLGLAPGTVGYSHLSVRVPGRVSGLAQLNCSLRKLGWQGSITALFPVN